jgi:hypothetical protein
MKGVKILLVIAAALFMGLYFITRQDRADNKRIEAGDPPAIEQRIHDLMTPPFNYTHERAEQAVERIRKAKIKTP